MARNSVMADTCAWIDFFNGTPTSLAQALEQLLASGNITTCGPVVYELIQGIRSRREEDAILSALDAVHFIEITKSSWIKAGKLSGELRKQGLIIPHSDIVIATLAIENGNPVLTMDRHFHLIPDLTVITSYQDFH